MKKRSLLAFFIITVVAIILFAFPSGVFANGFYSTSVHFYYSIVSTPFNEEVTICKDYDNYSIALRMAQDMARGIMYRDDIQAKIDTLSNEEFIAYIYDGLFHRTPDASGAAAWLAALNSGLSRSDAIESFINSIEFEMRYIYNGVFYNMPRIF